MVQKILCVMLITVCSLCAKAQVTLSFSALEFSSILKGESDTLTFGITNTGSTPQDVRVVITDRGNPLKYQPGNFHFGGSNPIEDSVLILTLNPGESRTSIPIYFYGQSFGQKEALVKTTNSGVETVGLVYGEVQKRSDRSLLKPGERYVDFLRVQKGLVQNQIVTFKNSTNRTLNVMEYLKPKLYPDIFSIKDDITVDPPKLLFPSETLELTVQCIMDFYGEVHDTITVLSDGADSKYYSENYIILSATCYDEGAKFRVLIAEDLSHTMYVNEIGDSISKKVIIENIGVKEGKYAIQLSMGEFFSINGKSTVDTVTLKANALDTIAIQYKAGKEERVGDFLSIFLSNPIPGLQTTSTLNGIVLRKDTVYLYVENSSPSLSDSHQVVVRLQSTLSNNAKK